MNAADSSPAVSVPRPSTALIDQINLGFQFRRYYRLVCRRWAILLAGALLGLGISGYRAFTSPDIFRASSKLGISLKLDLKKPEIVEEMNNYFENQLQYMLGGDVLGKVFKRMADFQSPTGVPPQVIPKAQRGVGSFFLMIVDSTDFKYAQLFATRWAEEFIQYKNELRARTLQRSSEGLFQEVALNDKKLEKALSDIAAFQQKHNIISAQQMGDAAQKRLDAAIDEHQQKKKQRQLYENMTKEEFATSLEEGAKKATAGSRSKEGPATSATDTTDLLGSVGDTRYSELLLTLKTKQADQRFRSATLKPRHPFMVRLSQEIAKYEQQRDFILEQVETRRLAQVAGLKKEEASYEPLIEEYRKQVNDLRGIQQEYEALKSEETRIKNTLDNLRKQVDAVNMTSVYEEQIDIVEKGVGLPTPVSPNRGRMLLMGLMVGLAAGIGLIYFLHRLDDRLELAEDIEAELEEPILGQIPQMDLKSVSNGGILVTQLDPHSMYSESLRGVRSALMFGSLQQSKRIMIVTSAVPGDGKTTFAVNFALTLANAGNRVLLVDADLRRGSTHTFFNHQREPGLTEALEEELDWRDVVRSFDTNKQPLGIIHSGRLPDNPGELLISPACKRLIEEVRNEYDNVIFDSPPLTSIDDTFSLVSLANGVVFVVKAGQTSMRFAKNALAAVRQRGANVFGSVVNGIGADSPYYYYANYYHAYYAKESKGAVAAPHAGGRKKRFEKPAQAVASGSIQAAAQSLAGQPSSKRQIAAQEQIKVAQFKSRRSAQTAMLARQELSPQEKTDAAIAPVAGPKGHEQS